MTNSLEKFYRSATGNALFVLWNSQGASCLSVGWRKLLCASMNSADHAPASVGTSMFCFQNLELAGCHMTSGPRRSQNNRVEARATVPEAMKAAVAMTMALASLFVLAPLLCAQAQNGGSGSGAGQSQPAHAQNPPAVQSPKPTSQQNNQNPFPEDLSNIPVIPSQNTPSAIYGEGGDTGRIPMPASESDPVLSPEDAAAAAEGGEQSSSSSTAGLRDLLSPVNGEKQSKRGHDKDVDEPQFHETAANDENVGKYYLDNQNWKAALSRFESAMVLDPENPDVYWGMAESERHLGQFAEARANYMKVIEYDPGGHLSKEAKKALKTPEIANAKAQTAQSSTAQQ